jgi:hypothetical protein
MKKIPLKQAFNRLRECAAVIVENNALIYPSLDEITGDKENEFLYLSWEEDGLSYNVKFVEENNSIVSVSDDGCLMLLIDNEGDRVQLTLLKPATEWENELAGVTSTVCRSC